MNFDADIVSFRANEAAIRYLLQSNPVARDLSRRAIRVESRAKELATGQASHLGIGPNVRSGRLRGSITWRLGQDDESVYADVGSAVEYAIYVEEGTSRMGPRPFLRPALEEAADA